MKAVLTLVISFLLGGLAQQSFGRVVPCKPEGTPMFENAIGFSYIKVCKGGLPNDPSPADISRMFDKLQSQDPANADRLAQVLSSGQYTTSARLAEDLLKHNAPTIEFSDKSDISGERSEASNLALREFYDHWNKEFKSGSSQSSSGDNIFDPKVFNAQGMVNQVLSDDLLLDGVQCRNLNGSLRGFPVTFSDGEVLTLIPLKMEPIGASKNKWTITYRTKNDANLISEVQKTEIYVPDGDKTPVSWKNKSGLGKSEIPSRYAPKLEGEALFQTGVQVGDQKPTPLCVAEASLEKVRPVINAGARENSLNAFMAGQQKKKQQQPAFEGKNKSGVR